MKKRIEPKASERAEEAVELLVRTIKKCVRNSSLTTAERQYVLVSLGYHFPSVPEVAASIEANDDQEA